MSRHPLYALLCFQLAFTPAVMAAPPTWEGKRAEMAKDVKEALDALEKLDRAGPSCSENYLKSQCPKTMPQPPKQSFVEAARKNFKEVERELAGIAADAKIADQAFDPKQSPSVDSCGGAGSATAADASRRKAAVDKMNAAFARMNSLLQGDLKKLYDSGPSFQSNLNACIKEVAGAFSFLAAAANLPKSPHGALENLWSQDSKHPQCPRDALGLLHKVTGKNSADNNALMKSLATFASEYTINLTNKSADLAKYTKVVGEKVGCKTPDGGQLAAKPGEDKKPGISGNPEEKPGTVAGSEPGKTPEKEKATGPAETAQKPAVEKKPEPSAAETTANAKKLGEGSTGNPSPAGNNIDTILPAQKTLTPESPSSENSTSLSKGHVAAGLAVLGVGAGAAYLLFSKKDKGSNGDAYIPTATNTATASDSQTSTQTATSSASTTITATSTSTGPTSSSPYTGTLTATSIITATSSATATQTSTSTSTRQ